MGTSLAVKLRVPPCKAQDICRIPSGESPAHPRVPPWALRRSSVGTLRDSGMGSTCRSAGSRRKENPWDLGTGSTPSPNPQSCNPLAPRGHIQPRAAGSRQEAGCWVSPSLPTHVLPCRRAEDAVLPPLFSPLSPHQNQNGVNHCRSEPARDFETGGEQIKQEGRGEGTPFLPFFLLFFPPSSPTPPQKTERQTANNIIAEMWRVIIAIQELIIHIKQGEASFSFACLRLYAFQKSFPQGI